MASTAHQGTYRFAGKGVIVTGGASGIGAATALRFLSEGATVVIADRNAPALEAMSAHARSEGLPLHAVVTDVTQAGQIDELIEQSHRVLPRIDVLINNAGVVAPQRFLDISEESWDRTLDINLKGMFLVAQRVARVMVAQGSGTIVNTASTNGFAAEESLADYNASKGGIVMLTRSMALELAPNGIRVNAVCPGFIDTALNQADDSYLQAYTRKIPLGRIGRAEEVAGAFAFLASDDASFITGALLVADGGQSIHH